VALFGRTAVSTGKGSRARAVRTSTVAWFPGRGVPPVEHIRTVPVQGQQSRRPILHSIVAHVRDGHHNLPAQSPNRVNVTVVTPST
jgi:hypothetical protein